MPPKAAGRAIGAQGQWQPMHMGTSMPGQCREAHLLLSPTDRAASEAGNQSLIVYSKSESNSLIVRMRLPGSAEQAASGGQGLAPSVVLPLLQGPCCASHAALRMAQLRLIRAWLTCHAACFPRMQRQAHEASHSPWPAC